MNKHFQSIKKVFSENRVLLRNFLILFCVFALVLSIFSVILYRNSRKVIQSEFTAANAQEADNLASYLDNSIMEMRYMASTLESNELTKFAFSSTNPEVLFPNYQKQVSDILIALQYSRKAIDAIYLYSGLSNKVYTTSNQISLPLFSDQAWIDCLEPDEYGFTVFPYTMQNRYPFVICIVKQFTVNGKESAVAIMLNLSKLSEIAAINQDEYKSLYLVNSQNEIIYRAHQKALPEALSTIPLLEKLDFQQSSDAVIKNCDNHYAVSVRHSGKYSWNLILTTEISNYTSALSSRNALLAAALTVLLIFAIWFSLFFTLQSFKPVRQIRRFLEQPDPFFGQTIQSADVDYISHRIIQLMQNNTKLREDLSSYLEQLNSSQQLALQSQINPHFLFNTLNMMYVQATDALGYDHVLPQMILDTSALFRYAIDTTEMVTLDTELSYTDIYLQILSQRYENNLIVQKDFAENTLQGKVPRLFIQPILENAVFHGFSERFSSICVLTLHSHLETLNDVPNAKYLVVSIRDNGCGMSQDKLQQLIETLSEESKGKSIGLKNVVQRMRLIYGNVFRLSIESKENIGTCFTLRFPYWE